MTKRKNNFKKAVLITSITAAIFITGCKQNVTNPEQNNTPSEQTEEEEEAIPFEEGWYFINVCGCYSDKPEFADAGYAPPDDNKHYVYTLTNGDDITYKLAFMTEEELYDYSKITDFIAFIYYDSNKKIKRLGTGTYEFTEEEIKEDDLSNFEEWQYDYMYKYCYDVNFQEFGYRINDPKCYLDEFFHYTEDNLHFLPASDYDKFCKNFLPSRKVFKKVDESFLPDCYKK